MNEEDLKKHAAAVVDMLRAGDHLGEKERAELRREIDELKKLAARPAAERDADLHADARRVSASLREYEARNAAQVAADPKKGAGLRVGAYVRALAIAHREHTSVADALHRMGLPKLAEEAEAYGKRALSTGAAADGGTLIGPGFMAEVIELLRNVAVVRQIPGVRVVRMPNGHLTMAKQTAAASAAYGAEGAATTPSQLSTGQIELVAKKLSAITVVSNDLLRNGDASADALVRDDLVEVMSLEEDSKFIRGNGSAGTPRGLFYSKHSTMTGTSAGTSAANMNTDVIGLLQKVASANIRFSPANAAFLMSERSKYRLMGALASAGGTYQFPDVQQGRLMGYQILSTNAISDAISSAESEVYFVVGSNVIIGETLDLELTVDNGAAYELNGAVYSGFQRDQTLIRAIKENDIGLRHDKTLSHLSAVNWG